MFEDYTSEALLEAVVENAPPGIDTREGSIFYDSVAAVTDIVAKLYSDLDFLGGMTMVDTAEGEALTLKAEDYGITRRSAVAARYEFHFTGEESPEPGDRFYYDGLYFFVWVDDAGQYYLEAEEAGEAGNSIIEGTPAVPVDDIDGLESSTFGAIARAGYDEESDDALRTRVREKISGPSDNGNKQQYKTWCESVDGVGRALIYPLWNGPNTVKGVLIDPAGRPCSVSVVNDVQMFIDPNMKGYTAEVEGKTYIVGDGLGEGIANLGAHFTATSASPLYININVDVFITSGSTGDQAEHEITEAVSDYLKRLVFDTTSPSDIVVRFNTIGAMISTCGSVLDYSNLMVNGGSSNIYPAHDDVAIVGEVNVNVL